MVMLFEIGCCRSAKEPGQPAPSVPRALLWTTPKGGKDKVNKQRSVGTISSAKGSVRQAHSRPLADASLVGEEVPVGSTAETFQPSAPPPARSSARSTAVSVADKLACESDAVTFEMTCDALCIRTMTVTYMDEAGRRTRSSKSGYNVYVRLPASCTDVEVTFSVVGGGPVHKVDRNAPGLPWVKDTAGQYVQERFFYKSDPPKHVQYFMQGPTFHCFVAEVDERRESESLLALASSDYLCLRTMHVSYVNGGGTRQQWSGSGYDVKCHLPFDARDVEVTFSVVGGRKVPKVDRRDPELPWVADANGNRPIERFLYAKCPPCVQYTLCGPSFGTYVRKVFEQRPADECLDEAGLLGGSADAAALFEVATEDMPSIGGIVDLRQPHSEFLLPSEVVLFEPSEAELFNAASGARQIFLNTPLSDKETTALAELHRLLAKRGVGGPEGAFPRYMEQHALRMLQTCKFNTNKAVEMMKTCVSQRLRRLPMSEADVADDLKSGFIYWHGRDRKCRPCLVLRLERLGEMAKDKERAVRMVVFALEYALRFAMVPGRVENWVVVIDLANVMNVISPMSIGSTIATAAALGTTLEKVYCGRMAWIKIINMPGGAWLNRAINGVIPTEKKDKVGFPADFKSDLAAHFEPNQLEQRYGGTAPDVDVAETYPYRFLPRCRGLVAAREHPETVSSSEQARLDTEDFSLHESTSLAFHEGQLWDRSSEHAEGRWSGDASLSSLTPASAAALSVQLGEDIAPCRDMQAWLAMTNPEAMRCYSETTCSGEDRATTSTTTVSTVADDGSYNAECMMLSGEVSYVYV